MIRILHILKRYNSNYPLLNEMVRLDPNRFESYICYLEGNSDGHNEIETLVEAVYYDFNKVKGRTFNTTKSAYSLSKIIQDHGIDIVNCHLEKTMPVGILASLMSENKPKVVTTLHGLEGLETDSGYSLRKKIKNFIYYRLFDKVICVSNSIKEDIIKKNIGDITDKVVSVQNGLIYDKFLSVIPKEEARFNILPQADKNWFWFGTVGRLAEVKNHKNMITAFRSIADKNPQCLLLIVGDGPLKEELFSQVRALKLTENVLLLGRREDVADILKALDVFIFTSYREGFGLAMLEAMASGLPVIASDIPVFREIFDDCDIGKLVDPSDPPSLVSAMSELMDCPKGLLRNMGEKAKNRAVGHFSAARMSQSYEALYEQICQNAG